MMPCESVPRRFAHTSMLAQAPACSRREPGRDEDRADEGLELGLADPERFLRHQADVVAVAGAVAVSTADEGGGAAAAILSAATDRYQSSICTPFQCSTPSKRLT